MAEGKTVFIVEDDEELGDLMKMRLESIGCRVLSTHGGDDIIRAVSEAKPDLVVLDVFLPDVDGLTVLKRLKAPFDIETGKDSLTKDIPVIMITGKAPMVENLTRVAGASDFFVKPIQMEKFIGRVRELLAGGGKDEQDKTQRNSARR